MELGGYYSIDMVVGCNTLPSVLVVRLSPTLAISGMPKLALHPLFDHANLAHPRSACSCLFERTIPQCLGLIAFAVRRNPSINLFNLLPAHFHNIDWGGNASGRITYCRWLDYSIIWPF